MEFKPHEYQKYCIRYIVEHPLCAVFLDPGMGKTSIALMAISILMDIDCSKVLIVAPKRVALTTWPDEIQKWDQFNDLTYSVVSGNRKQREAALQKEAQIYIISRDLISWMVLESGCMPDFDMAVLDELSSFANARSKRDKAFLRLRTHLDRVVGLTASPAANGYERLFGEFLCIDRGQRLGRFITRFRNEFMRPDRSNGMVVYSYKLQPDGAQRITDKISDICVSMKALDYLKMPELITNRYQVQMNEKEKKIYKTMKKEMFISLESKGETVTADNAAAVTSKLCQLSNGCVYSDKDNTVNIHTRKLDAMEDLLEARQGKPTLVVYWFRGDYELICKRLDELGIVYANLNSDDAIWKWNAGKLEVGLLQPASMGFGVNLQEAPEGNTEIWYGPIWSYELYQQTVARLWRQGQKCKTVIIEIIVTEGTVDADICSALERKETGQEALLDAVKAQIDEVSE